VSKKSENTPIIFEKNPKTGQLAFSKNFLLFAVLDDLEKVMMSSQVF
jgi:hypothetical protein